MYGKIEWVGASRPTAEPKCGFAGEKCISMLSILFYFFFSTARTIIIFLSGYTGEISAGIAGGALLLLGIVSLVLYRNWRYEQELDSLLWKIDFREVHMHESEKDSSAQKQTRVSTCAFKYGQYLRIEVDKIFSKTLQIICSEINNYIILYVIIYYFHATAYYNF